MYLDFINLTFLITRTNLRRILTQRCIGLKNIIHDRAGKVLYLMLTASVYFYDSAVSILSARDPALTAESNSAVSYSTCKLTASSFCFFFQFLDFYKLTLVLLYLAPSYHAWLSTAGLALLMLCCSIKETFSVFHQLFDPRILTQFRFQRYLHVQINGVKLIYILQYVFDTNIAAKSKIIYHVLQEMG